MTKFDMGRAWGDAMALLGSHRELVLAIAGVFLFLPAVAFGIFGPAEIETGAVAPGELLNVLIEYYGDVLPYILAMAILSMIGTVAIARLYLGARGTSVGAALAFAVAVLLTMIAARLITGLAVGLGLVLLIVPGLYLAARLSMTLPVIADRGIKNPLTVLDQSWKATQGNGWRLLLYFVILVIVAIVVALVIGGVTGLIFAAVLGENTAQIVSAVIAGLLEAAIAVVSVAIICGAYRQLAGGETARTHDMP